MSERYFIDGVSTLYCHGEIVKVDFINLDNKKGEFEANETFGIAMTTSSFMKFRETINELYDKMTEKEKTTKETPKVSLKSKKKKSE